MTLDETIDHAKELSEKLYMADLNRENFKQLAAWLEELKQYKEQNQETNLDHFQQEILEKGLWNLAVVKGRPKRCDRTKCIDCELSKDRSRGCHEKAIDWIKQPYIKQPYIKPTCKLTKFEYDLLQSYLNIYKHKFKDTLILIRMKEKGYFKDVDEDAKIKDILANYEIIEEKED